MESAGTPHNLSRMTLCEVGLCYGHIMTLHCGEIQGDRLCQENLTLPSPFIMFLVSKALKSEIKLSAHAPLGLDVRSKHVTSHLPSGTKPSALHRHAAAMAHTIALKSDPNPSCLFHSVEYTTIEESERIPIQQHSGL